MLAENSFIQCPPEFVTRTALGQYTQKQFIRVRQRLDKTINSAKAKITQEEEC